MLSETVQHASLSIRGMREWEMVMELPLILHPLRNSKAYYRRALARKAMGYLFDAERGALCHELRRSTY